MICLLDTHALLWMAGETSRLSSSFMRKLQTEAVFFRISVASAWELAIKYESGKLKLPLDVEHFWQTRLESIGVVEIPISSEYALVAAKLPPVHRDPFDRVIAATALTDDLFLITADPVFQKYGCKVIDPTA